MQDDVRQSAESAVLATMHGKEVVIAPILKRELGLAVWVPDDFDTDAFGTFTRETARRGTQLEAARAKARAAMDRYGSLIGIASEGSFAAHPQLPMLQRNLELVVLIDAAKGVEVVGQAHSNAVAPKQAEVRTVAEALAQAQTWGFPEQGVILRRSARSNRHIKKELRTIEALTGAVGNALRWPWVRSLTLETDMRAHRCPARLDTIAAATRDLVVRYRQQCPACRAPGFVPRAVAETARCRQCQLSTDVPYRERYRCQVCGHTCEKAIVKSSATVDPGQCARCNP